MFRLITNDGDTETEIGRFGSYAEAEAALNDLSAADWFRADWFILNERGEGFGPLGGGDLPVEDAAKLCPVFRHLTGAAA